MSVKIIFLIILFLGGIFLLYDKYYPMNLVALTDTSTIIYAEDKHWLYVTTNKEQKWRFNATLLEIDPLFLKMLLAYEDKNFYTHYGVDIGAMFRAVWQLFANQRIISGASTITMQLARLLYPEKRTIFAKLKQILYALQLEYHYSKSKILSAYLTLTPYGGNIEGIVAGSMRYFGKRPQHLTASQSALLITLPQSPNAHRPDKHLKEAIKSRDKVLNMLHTKGFMNHFVYKQSLNEKLTSKIYLFPRYAGHIAQKIMKNKPFNPYTTLNKTLQEKIEIWAKKQDKSLANNTTIALLVIENNSSEIKAYLGSHDRFSSRVSGYIDMVQAIRSPASTLKPFIYGLGFEAYLIHPQTIILDEEVRFGDYTPHNFTQRYLGEVTIAFALQYSLNIPAVKVLQRIGVENFIEKLRSYSDKIYIPKEKITLPVALGGLGLSLWELGGFYTALANKGKAYPLHYLKVNKAFKLKFLLTPNASHLTTEILRKNPRPQNFLINSSQIAYKTGTSYGYRDAWSIAYNKSYTVIMWVGKPTNSIQLGLTGLKTATPLAFEIFSMLYALLPQKKWNFLETKMRKKVPKNLYYFDKKKRKNEKSLRFLFPPKNSRFRSADCSESMVEIKIENGVKPYYWYIDGKKKEINNTQTEESFNVGGHKIQIIDTKGNTISRDIWVDKPEC